MLLSKSEFSIKGTSPIRGISEIAVVKKSRVWILESEANQRNNTKEGIRKPKIEPRNIIKPTLGKQGYLDSLRYR